MTHVLSPEELAETYSVEDLRKAAELVGPETIFWEPDKPISLGIREVIVWTTPRNLATAAEGSS